VALTERSLKQLVGVHPDLQAIVMRASEGPLYFIVTEGLRSAERQAYLVAHGKSRTLRSRHRTGHAVDLAVVRDGVAMWDWPSYALLARIVKAAAAELDLPVEWGGDWQSFRDGPHFQLPWATHPGGEDVFPPRTTEPA